MSASPDSRLHLRESALFRISQWFCRLGFGWVLKYYCTITLHDAKRIQGLAQCILAPTHASHLDFWAVLEGLEPRLLKQTYVAAAADYFYNRPWRRLLMRLISYHNFPFIRQHVSPADYQRLLDILGAGFSLLIFPQASRSRDGQLVPFKPLVAMAAVEAQVPLVPVVVKGSFEALPAGSCWPRRSPLHVYFGEPLYPDPPVVGKSLHSQAKALNARLMERIQMLWSAADASLPKA